MLGGGGDMYYALLRPLPVAEDFGPAALVDVDELPGDGLIMPCGEVGAPLVGLGKIEAGDEEKRPAGPDGASYRPDGGRPDGRRDRRRQPPSSTPRPKPRTW